MAGLTKEDLLAFGTPLYVYDLDIVSSQVAALRQALPARFEVAYAVKANPALAVVAHLSSLDLAADVASEGELELARKAGFRTDRTIFTGPGKRAEEIAAAVDAGVRAITVESPGELRRVIAAARQAGRRMPILLRLATGAGPGGSIYHVEGGAGQHESSTDEELSGKFGMDPADLRRTAAAAVRSPHVELLGVHAFGLSNVLDADRIADHVATTVAFATEVFRDLGVPLRLVDVGGGLGFPYPDDEQPLDLGKLRRRLAALDRAWSRQPSLADLRVLFEPGRFLVAPAGAYVARVLEAKSVGGQRIAVTDGGIHHALRPALVSHVHRVRLLGSTRRHRDGAPTLVAGPLCTSLDVLGELESDAEPRSGDLVVLLDVGAYGYTMSMTLFLSHPMPAEVAVRGGRAQLIRPRLSPSAWLEAQRLPTW